MQSFVTSLLNLLFPLSAEARVVKTLAEYGDVYTLYNPQHYRGVTALASFKNPTIRALIHEAKFHHSREAITLLAKLVDRYLATLPTTSETIIMPIPLSRQRLRERGYNQALEILRLAIPNHPQITLADTVLTRPRHTISQTTLTRAERISNLQNAFSVLDGDCLSQKSVIIFDDVVTTGATLDAATAAILPHKPASITRLAIAH